MPYDKIDELYDALKKDGAVSKSRENFRSKMLAPGKEGYQNRLQLYNALKADGAVESPTYEEFSKRLGMHAVKPQTTTTAAPQQQKPATQAAPIQQKPITTQAQASTPAPSAAPAQQQKDQPLTPAQRQAMIDQVQQMRNGVQASLDRANNRMDFAKANMGLNVPRVTLGGSNNGVRLGQNSRVVAKKPKFNARTGKMEQTYITESGNEYNNRAAADLEQNAIDEEARQPLGLNMNEQQVSAAQKPADAVVAALWKEAEAQHAADREKNAEDVYGGNPWLHGGREMHIVDAATNAHKNEVSHLTRFDLQKMMDNAWGRVGKQMTEQCYQQLQKQYPTATARQLQMSAEQMARALSDNAVYKYAVAKNTPKSTLEFFAKTAADTNLLRTITKGLARSEAGTTGDLAAYEQAMSDYGKNHRVAQIGGTVTGMLFDPTTYISGGVGSFAGKTALNIGGRIVAKKAATNVGARLFGNTLTGRVVAGMAGGAGNLGAYEGIKEVENQYLHGGHINPQTGENEGYSAGDVLKSSLHGALLGSVTGTFAPLLGNVTDKMVKATSSTAGKVGIRAGELATSTVAEGTIFSVPEWISGDRDAMDVWTDNMAMMIGFKAQHMVKSAPRVIAGLRPIENPKTMQERNHNRMSFVERLRKQVDASPRDMAFTKEEREELQRYGYGDLAVLFTRTPKQPKAKAKPESTDGKVMYLDIPEAKVEDLGKQWLKQHPEFDGYEAMERLMQDPNVSQSARAKAYYILTGRQLPMGSVTGYTTEQDENGNIFVKSVTANGEVVTNRRFADEASAKREQDKIMRQVELNSVDVGERYTEAKADSKVWEAAIDAVAPGADPETVKRNYQAAKEGDKDAITNYGQMVEAIDKFMEENKGMADTERPEAIRSSIEEETGIDVDKALKKEPSKRTEPEQAAVEDYLKRLFPDQNGEGERPMSDDEAGASAIYDQSRLLWDKVEQGDADAKAEVDAIAIRMKEAYQLCEDAFGSDAEMRMAEMEENPWTLFNNPELTEDQQDAVLYYINAKAAMDGVHDASNDAMENKRREVAANVERHTHKDYNLVQPATMKVDDRQVYIVKGNIVPLPDGTGIDVRNSDQSIVVCDAETGEYKFTSPDQIYTLGEAIDPQSELDEAYANIQAEYDAVLGGNGYGSTENGNPMPEYGVNDTFTLRDTEGNAVSGEVQGISEDGVEIRTDIPINGKYVQVIPAEEFEGMVESLHDADGNTVWDRNPVAETGESVPGTPENVQTEGMDGQQPMTNEEEANRKPTALERVPLDEKTGEPMFEKADKETALDALNEVTGGNEANTTAIVNAQVEQAQKALDALKKKQPIKKAPALKGSPMAMLKAQQEADANYNAAMEQYNGQVAQAEETLNAWSRIYALMNERKRAIREQQESEQRERDRKLHDEAVAQVEEQKRIAAEKAAEQAEVGTHAVNPKIKEKWEGAAKVEGNANAITLADGSTIRGHYVLTEAGAASASHDISNGFEPTEGFPIDENGESVNDRDYKRDTDAQQIVRDIARNYDSRALQSPVIVSKDGIVLSGNNRTMSGDMAAQHGTDKAYVDHLREFGQMYGFTPEQIDGMQHPRVVFVPDEELPYDASTFARFNAEQQKKQGKDAQAVKLGKVVPDNVFNSIVGDISRYDRLSDFYADDKAVASAISQLLGAGVINEMQLPEMRTGNALSAAGRELIENTLIGKVFQTSPDAVRQIISTPTLRHAVIMGLNEIAHNRTLAKSGYDLSQELGAAVDLVARAKAEAPDIYKEGMPVSPYGRQAGLFDDEYGDSRVTDATVLLLADVLNSGKPSDLRKMLATYNNEAQAPASGQIDMFSGDVRSKEQLLNDVNEYFRNATPREQQAIVDAAVAERKQRAEANSEAGNVTGRSERSANRQGVGGLQEEARDEVANQAMSHDEAIAFIAAMENRAEVAPSVDLSIENWDALFGKDGIVNTPIGEVKMGDNQFTKMMREDRHGKLGMVKPTLENPDVILEDASKAKEDDTEERPSSYIFVKAFKKADGSRYYYFTSITVSKDGREVVVSNQEKRKNAIANLLSKDRLVWKHADDVSDASDVAQGLYSSQGNVSDLATEGTDAPQTSMSNNIWSASEVQNDNSAVVSDGLQSEPIADNDSTSNGTPSKKGKLQNRFDGGAQTERHPADVYVTTSPGIMQGNDIVWPEPTVGSNASTDTAEVVDSPTEVAKGETVDRGGNSSQPISSVDKVINNQSDLQENAEKSPANEGEMPLSEKIAEASAGVKKETVANAPAKAGAKGYSITPTTYTNKKGKTSDVSLLTFDHDLTADQERAVKEFAKERTGEGRFAPARGLKDRESGGWMFRSEEDARKAAEMVGNEDAVADNQPLTAQELRDAIEPKKPAARKKATVKKPANKVELPDNSNIPAPDLEVQNHDWSQYKQGDIFDYEGFKSQFIHVDRDESGRVTGVIVQHLDENGNPIPYGREDVPPLMFMLHYKAEKPQYEVSEQKATGAVPVSHNERVLRDAVDERLREGGLDVFGNTEEGQRVLDMANGGGVRQMAFGEPYDYGQHPLGRVEPDLADKNVEVVNTTSEHGFANYNEAKSWAKGNISRTYDSEETGGKGEVRISNSAIDKFLSQSAVNKSESKDVHMAILKVLPEVLKTSIDVETHPDFLKGENGKRSSENGINKDVLVHRCYGAVGIDGKTYRVKITLKENIKTRETTNTHSYEATKIELLAGQHGDVTKTSPRNSNNSISAANLLNGVEISYNPGVKVLDESKKRSGQIREQRVYHGSQADFDHFDNSHMGEGEGRQAFGWGTYLTSVEGVGRFYANQNSRINDDNYGIALHEYETAESDCMFAETRYNRSGKKVAAKEEALESAKQELADAKKNNNSQLAEELESKVAMAEKNLSKSQNEQQKAKSELERAKADMEEKKRILDSVPTPERHLYHVTIPDDNGSNYYDWRGDVSSDTLDRITESLRNRLGDEFVDEEWIPDMKSESDKGSIMGITLYHKLESALGSDKAASLFLADLGYTGIKYPTNDRGGGRRTGEKNYVIFNEADAKITDHVRFFRTANGEAYGFTVGGKIYYDPRIATSETLVHEYAHLWASALRAGNPKEWQNVVGLMKGTSVWEDVKRRYPELNTDDEIADEVLAQYSGKRGAERLREEARKIAEAGGGVFEKAEAISALERVKRALSAFWKGVCDMLHIHFTSAEEVADRVMKDLLDGVDPREFGKESAAKAFAEKHDIEVSDVEAYENAMELGNVQSAHWAMGNIRRAMRIKNKGLKLSEFKDVFAPVRDELYARFGNLDELQKEYEEKALSERNAMEAARKKAEEEAAERQKHLDELSLLSDKEIDKNYMDALDRGDEATAREMLDEAARRKGYADAESDYQGVGAWAAPSNPGYESDEARRADVEYSGSDVNLEDMALGYSRQPDDYFTHPERYSQDTPHGRESAKAIQNALEALKRGEKGVKVKVYRAVPISVKEGKLRNGDWVTPSKKYAEMHGNNRLEGKYRIIEDEVPAEHLWWDANDANEFGYDDGKSYRYKNAKNNRKLNDLVTRDDKGNVIPPSKRFNSRKADVRYQFVGEKGAEVADRAEEVTTRLDNLSIARSMEEAKKDAKTIKLATGWERGVDGKWRYEIPDIEYVPSGDANWKKVLARQPWAKELEELADRIFDEEKLSGKEMTRFDELCKENDELYKTYKESDVKYLDDYAPNDALYKAYPELKQTRVEFVNNPSLGWSGKYSRKDNTIFINGSSDFSYRSTLAHEIQHAIQDIEGFAEGGNTESVRSQIQRIIDDEQDASDYAKQQLKKYATLHMHAARLEAYKLFVKSDQQFFRDKAQDYYWDAMNELDNMDDSKLVNEYPDDKTAKEIAESGYHVDEAIKELKRLGDECKDEIPEGNMDALEEVNKLTSALKDKSDYELYNALAGEVEARNVQKRMDMTEDERRNSLAAETEDVAREDQIFLFGDGGTAHMGSRTDKRMAEIGEHFEGKELSDEQRAVVDVFSGKRDRKTVDITNNEGVSIHLEMQQGNEPNAGARHSIFRHVGKNNGSISYDEIGLIPDIVKTGTRNDKGANVVYQKKIDGVRYTIYTDKKGNKEVFHDFYSNRKTAESESFSGKSTNTQSSARTSDNAVSAAKLSENRETAKDNSEKVEEDGLKFRLLEDDDPKAMELESLPESELVAVYRNVQAFEDDALGSPMAFTDAETGERRTLQGGKWNASAQEDIELTPEQQRQLDELNKNGYIVVDGKKTNELKINNSLFFKKGKTGDAQLQYWLKKNPEDSGVPAAYDPYDHAIETPLNTQFGTAYKRPNLVVVRSLIPKSEIDEPYHAKYALLPTGAHDWNNGRTLYLSRWSKIDKVLTREEEAKLIDEYWKKNPGKREALKSHRDYNRFVPQVRRELEKMGYRFELDGRELTPEESLALDEQNWENRDAIPGRKGHIPFISNDDIARINAKMSGKWVGEPKEAMENAMTARVNELSESLNTPVRIVRTDAEVAALPSARQRRMKGSFNPLTGEVTIVVPNNANLADVENTFVHEVVGHDGLRVLFPEKEKLDNALDELYRVSNTGIQQTIDRMAQKMYDAEVDRLREKKRKEHEAKGEDTGASYYADMAEAHVEASKKREQFKREATEEYGADLAGRIGESGFEKMSAEEQTFWGKLKAMLQKALQKLLDGLKIPGKKKWSDKEWAFVLHEAYKRKKNGGNPTVFDAADTEVMRRKTGFGETKFSDGHKKSAQPNEAALKHLEPIDVEHAAKVLQRREKAKEGLANVAKAYKNTTNSKGFISDLSNSLGLMRGSTGSGYGSFETPNGKVFAIRVSNHNINAANVGNEPVESIVIKTKRSPNRFHAEDGKYANEYVYFKEDIRQAPAGTLSSIAESISELLDTGEYHDKTGLAKDKHSPETDPDNGIMFRDGDSEEYNKAMARDTYERRVASGMYQTQEALQDSMLGLKEAMDAILKAEGKGKTYIEEVAGYENAYLGENRLSSVNQAECAEFARRLFKPMLKEVAKLAKTADERAELTDYMMAKHGLERNEVMARRAAEKKANEEFGADIRKAERAVNQNPLDQDAIDRLDDLRQQRDDREQELYFENRDKDYSGLTALTGKDNVADAESEARQMVTDYENGHKTDDLWKTVNAVNGATLLKTYESGLINKATYDDIKGMYTHYIPLRGFDDKTSEEAYAYLADKHSAFNAPMKTAKGRKSKADDPFANMEAMAESAIMQGNRNTLVKQKFLNFALNHPSDLVSVSDLWLRYDDVRDEWIPVNSGDIAGTEKLKEDDSAAEVERKMRDFEDAMEQAAKSDPAHFKKQKDAPDIPYRVVESRDLRQHQVLVKRNGKDYLLTINGNPRAAQALNGQTNPDNDVSGAIGAIMHLGEKVNRQLSAFYTTRNPDFVVSNFMRDMMYANTMVWVKESPNYAVRFHTNVAKVNPVKMKILLAKLRNGTLDMNDETEKMFRQFMMNGGETGYANIRDIEQRKNDIKRELKKMNGKLPMRKAWGFLGERLDEYNRAVENCARFAAFMTSRQLGRTIDRSIWDAKEISVNFNKKGSGAKFMGANSQTKVGNVAAFTSGLGRSFYVFWNAAIQGTTNFWRQAKRHPKKAIAGAATMFLLGALMAYLGGEDGDDDGNKDAYYNLPEYVRRSNVVFRLPGMDKSWISLPLTVEYRFMYGMGELMVSAMSGKAHYTDGELAHAMASQVSQMFPIDFMEGSGGFKPFIPSAVKPVAEVITNESWTGMPIYKDTPFNKDDPEWTKAYKSANKYLVGLSKTLNEATGGDAYTSGKIDINPAQVEYLLNGFFGGMSSTVDKLTKMSETIIGEREYDPRSFLLLNRVVKNGDERTEYRAVNNEYFRIKEESEALRKRLNHYENDTADGVFDYAEKIAWLNNSPEYRILETYEEYSGDIDDINEELKDSTLRDDERKELEAELNQKKKELVDAVNAIRNGKQQ